MSEASVFSESSLTVFSGRAISVAVPACASLIPALVKVFIITSVDLFETALSRILFAVVLSTVAVVVFFSPEVVVEGLIVAVVDAAVPAFLSSALFITLSVLPEVPGLTVRT